MFSIGKLLQKKEDIENPLELQNTVLRKVHSVWNVIGSVQQAFHCWRCTPNETLVIVRSSFLFL
jgi:hypothetical protein